MTEHEYVAAKNGRFYRLTDTPHGELLLPSVTNILKVWPKGEGFERWLGQAESYQAAMDVRDAAGERGTQVHDAIHQLLTIGKVNVEGWDKSAVKLLQGFVNWYTEAKPKNVHSEITVYSVIDGYAGTLDILCELPQPNSTYDSWCIDVKTSSGVYLSHHVQNVAYANAVSEMREDGVVEVQNMPRPTMTGILWLKTSTKKGWQLVTHPLGALGDEADEWCYQKLYVNGFLSAKSIFELEHGIDADVEKEEVLPSEVSILPCK
jgi:hypothetical protein